MADQVVRHGPAGPSLGGFAGRIALALVLVVGVVVGVASVGRLATGLTDHLGLLLLGAIATIVVLIAVSRMVSRRPL